jgi:GTP-binding protein
MLPTVAIVGRPNVGKSTLFNRLIRSRKALTHDTPGVTRDRIYGEVRADPPFSVVDTGGLVLGSKADIEEEVLDQANEALMEAQLVLLVVDSREGLTPLDREVADFLRSGGKPVLLAANKVDGEEQEGGAAEFHALGFELVPVSAAHGYNASTLVTRIEELLEEAGLEAKERDKEGLGLRVAMLGRPNAGKSSIINALLGQKRLIVSEVPGTTRDSVDVTFEAGDKRYTFVDTAGVRRKGRIEEELERFSVLRSLRASKDAQVAVLVVDATQGLTQQDKKLLAFLDREKTPFLVAVNKMDLVSGPEKKEVREDFKQALRITPFAPVLHTSAKKGTGLKNLLPEAERILEQSRTRLSTGPLNRMLQDAQERHQPPMVKGRRARFYYLTQTGTQPPSFVFFVNDPALVKPAYARFLENQIRRNFGLDRVPMRIRFRSSHEKAEARKR